jgi:hypothetical protein
MNRLKKILVNSFKILLVIIVVNQIVIFTLRNSIQNGKWKSNSDSRFSEHDFLDGNFYFKGNIIVGGRQKGLIQLYIGKKLLISNFTLTEWYLYENKG